MTDTSTEAAAVLALATGEAAADFRRWADGYRAEGNGVLADDCLRLADRLERLYPRMEVAS
jgi:hypothetical protein